jgi:SPP1 gp7 family putative phage head morphogenesis protein
MPSGGTKTPIEPGLIARIVQAGRVIAGADVAWMSPGAPLAPMADSPTDETRGRQMDFPVNINMVPRTRTNEGVTFEQLRMLADNCDILRIVIENEKDNLAKLKWKFKPKDEKKQPDDRCKQLTDFFAMPDQEHTWDDWIRLVVEDMLVIDAATVYPRPTKGGEPFAFEPMDGATIKRIIDPTGRTPAAPEPAYQQILKGLQAVNYSRDELIYRPRNLRTNRVYGYSPVEQVLTTVNTAIRRALNQLSYYTEGNVPDLLFGVPDTWQPDQIKQFQGWWDSLTAGQSKKHGRFIPGSVAPHDTKPQPLFDEFDEWLARVICFAFSTAPTPFIKSNNRATAQTAADQAQSEGLLPRMNWIRNLINSMIWKYFGYTDLEFDWDQEEALEPLEAAQIEDIKIKNGSLSVDEVRQADGKPPIGMGCAVYTATGPISVVDFDKQQAEQKKQNDAAAAAAATAMANGTHPSQQPQPGQGDPNEQPPGDKPPGTAPADKPEPADKHARAAVEKKKPRVKGTDPDAPQIEAGVEVIKPMLAKFLAEQAPKIAAQLAASLDLSKAAGDDEDSIEKALTNLDFSDWEGLPPLLTDALAGVAVAGGTDALKSLDLFSDDISKLMSARATAFAQQRAAEMVGMKVNDAGDLIPNPNAKWQITEGTRTLLRSTVEQAEAEGWSASKLSSAIQEGTVFSEDRAEMIARTESAKADVAGNIEGWRVSGVVDKKEWIAAPDCCDDCQELDGQIVDLDDSFDGDGGDGPPLHPRCRCNVLPVLSDE